MEAAPFHDDVAEGPADAMAYWVNAADGLRIRVAHWPKDGAIGTVLIFPGRTEYAEKYGRDAAALAERGFATVAIDWRGQGLAARLQDDRNIGHVGKFIDYQLDVAAVMDHCAALDLPKPWYLLGHSMGGCIGLRALHEQIDVAAAAFSAPMWGIQMSAVMRPAAWALSSLSRYLRFSHVFAPGQLAQPYVLRAAFEVNTLTSDEDMFHYMRRQLEGYPDLALGGPSLHWLNEALVEMRTLANMPAPDIDCVTFLGTDEAIVDTDRVHARMESWPNGDLVMIQNGRHEVLMETPAHRTAIFDRLAEHFIAHR
ncbi:alpha/beta hydrolase [Pelagovum pacificum]|uniref:Alpha/beta hydrolase n=2 Tax=Pelagovum pacificum TaxID=2588711 RepID=A0A5C5GHT7_9RHOB|nr:alpha/beta hydrolase [Pelagovum pacificum]QQA44899.1 alpha/beta hydrolase [Pelagovum pacificum]TNY34345.1 alpha/beta hydrolase [Pelagovum pacificum]